MNSHDRPAARERMPKERMAAFSDGVIAIIITIMVLELKAPKGADATALLSVLPVFLAYVLSFIYVAIYWNNHHHLLSTFEQVNGRILWANMLLLFWLSLIPFATGWMDEHHLASLPVALYGAVLLFAGCSYYLLQMTIVRAHGRDGVLAAALGADIKGKFSIAVYVVAIALAFYWPAVSMALYLLVAAMWFVPDRRIERAAPVPLNPTRNDPPDGA